MVCKIWIRIEIDKIDENRILGVTEIMKKDMYQNKVCHVY